MTVFIHRETRFNKCLEILKRGDKKSSMAAERAQEAIKELRKEDPAFLKETERLTKHGELRIDNCRKYDLGSGYRLICVEQGEDLVIAYVGAHDDCNRWIENNRRFEPELNELSEEAFSTAEEEDSGDLPGPDHEEEMDYDDILMKQIDDTLLRQIFFVEYAVNRRENSQRAHFPFRCPGRTAGYPQNLFSGCL